MIALYDYFRSSAAWRCRIALALKGVAYEARPVHLRRGEQRSDDYLRANPHGLVPTMTTGDFVLTQSLAIVEWLDETYRDPPLLPATADDRARVRAFALSIACDIHPLQNLRVVNFLRSQLHCDETAIKGWLLHWISEGLSACAQQLPDARPFCFGDRPGLADVCLAPQLGSAERFGVDIRHLPRLVALKARYDATPAFVRALPSNQPDFEP